MISNDKGYDIPELAYHAAVQYTITIRRIMAPFDWLLSSQDATFVNVVQPFLILR